MAVEIVCTFPRVIRKSIFGINFKKKFRSGDSDWWIPIGGISNWWKGRFISGDNSGKDKK